MGNDHETHLFCLLCEQISKMVRPSMNIHIRRLLYTAALHVAIASCVVKAHRCVNYKFLHQLER